MEGEDRGGGENEREGRGGVREGGEDYTAILYAC